MPIFQILTLLSFAFYLSGCSIYKSPDRKDFEASVSGFTAKNLILSNCSTQSIRTASTDQALVFVQDSTTENETVFLWRYKINNEILIESDNLKGVYCLYENI